MGKKWYEILFYRCQYIFSIFHTQTKIFLGPTVVDRLNHLKNLGGWSSWWMQDSYWLIPICYFNASFHIRFRTLKNRINFKIISNIGFDSTGNKTPKNRKRSGRSKMIQTIQKCGSKIALIWPNHDRRLLIRINPDILKCKLYVYAREYVREAHPWCSILNPHIFTQ